MRRFPFKWFGGYRRRPARTTINLVCEARYIHALTWLGEAWAGEAISNPQDVVNFYLRVQS
jgi:hypothetical protein